MTTPAKIIPVTDRHESNRKHRLAFNVADAKKWRDKGNEFPKQRAGYRVAMRGCALEARRFMLAS